MGSSNIGIWILFGVAVIALIGIGVLTRQQMRNGGTLPGPPSDMDMGTHDEPTEDVARVLDEKRHVHTTEDSTKQARDVGRTLGH